MSKNEKTNHSDPKDHLANERTFLAWIRTSLGIMAFGFLIERFVILLGMSQNLQEQLVPALSIQKSSTLFGNFLIIIGALMALLSLWNYRKVTKQINNNDYRAGFLLNSVLTLSVLLIGLFLVFFLT